MLVNESLRCRYDFSGERCSIGGCNMARNQIAALEEQVKKLTPMGQDLQDIDHVRSLLKQEQKYCNRGYELLAAKVHECDVLKNEVKVLYTLLKDICKYPAVLELPKDYSPITEELHQRISTVLEKY